MSTLTQYKDKSLLEQLRDQGINYQGELMTYEEARRRGIRLDEAVEERLRIEEEQRKVIDRERLFAQIRDREKQKWDSALIFEFSQIEFKKEIKAEPLPPEKAPEEITKEFKTIMVESGFKKTLPLIELFTHEFKLGKYLSEYQAEKDPAVKRICGICHDPACPFSD